MQRTQPLQKKLTANARSRLNTWQVRIVPNPPPKNLAQSRQILAALQKFGEVTTFRNLKVKDTLMASSNRHLIDPNQF